MSKKRYMPIGIQNFEKLRNDNCVYVDKTEYVWSLVRTSSPYFLSRPRRFRKSLLLSTLESYFLGRKDLFNGLALGKLEENGAKREKRDAWQVYPIFHIDLNSENYSNQDAIYSVLNRNLSSWESVWGKTSVEDTLSSRFIAVLQAAHKKTGKQCVVLVDEYDKPLLETIDNPEIQEKNRMTLKVFFGVINSEDAHIRFTFLTGVTKFAQVSGSAT